MLERNGSLELGRDAGNFCGDGLREKWEENWRFLVSADGLEPSTHALKGVGGSQTKHLQDLLGPLAKLL